MARADRAAELAQSYVSAMGGKDRIAALTTMRATGRVLMAGRELRFSLVAARPNRVRIETQAEGRTFVQGYDGQAAPWQYEVTRRGRTTRAMGEGDAKEFIADAEFDDPLVNAAERGYALDVAGETVIAGGKRVLRLMVTRRLTETYELLIDPETFFILRRVQTRPSPAGREVVIETHYDDFRPVAGVILPHRIAVTINGETKHQTVLDTVEPNPELLGDSFDPPVSLPTADKK